MAEPPLAAGAVHDTVTWGVVPKGMPITLTAVTPVGAPGALAGVTAFDGAEATEVPAELVAVTVKV